MNASSKHSSLLRCGNNYDRKMFYDWRHPWWKWKVAANTLAYSDVATIMAVKFFMIADPLLQVNASSKHSNLLWCGNNYGRKMFCDWMPLLRSQKINFDRCVCFQVSAFLFDWQFKQKKDEQKAKKKDFKARITNWRWRLSTVDLQVRVACFVEGWIMF